MKKRKHIAIASEKSPEIEEKKEEIEEAEEVEENIKPLSRTLRSESVAFMLSGKKDAAHIKHMSEVLEQHNLNLKKSKTKQKLHQPKRKSPFRNLERTWGSGDEKITTENKTTEFASALLWNQPKRITPPKTLKPVPQVPVFNSPPIITLK